MSKTNTTYDPAALERDIARHEDEMRRGEPGLTVEEALAWLRQESEKRGRLAGLTTAATRAGPARETITSA